MILEPLEKRLAPAGIISVILSGGALKITGDGSDNGLSIEEIAPDTFRITGNGTMISYNGGSGTTFDITNVTKGLTIDLKEGGDTLALYAMSVGGSVSVALGGGDNQLSLGAVSVSGDLSVTGLKGNDAITAANGLLNISGKTSINLGDGENTVEITNMTNVTFGKGLAYVGGSGTDDVAFDAASLQIGGALDFKVGASGGEVDISADTVNILGDVSFTSLLHVGELSTFSLNGGDMLNIVGSVTIKQGNGMNQSFILSEAVIAVGGDVSITHGNSSDGDFSQQIEVNSDDLLAIGGSVTVVNGTGDYETAIHGDEMIVGGKISVSNGNGNSSTEIRGDNIDVDDSITVTNKVGLYETTISAESLHVTNAITITNGNVVIGGSHTTGTTPVTLPTVNSITATDSMHAGAINITNGNGNYLNTIAMILQGEGEDATFGTASIANGITVKNGNSAPPTGGGGGGGGFASVTGGSVVLIVPPVTSTNISGNFDVGGNIAISNGNGGWDNFIGDNDALGSFDIGGNITFTNGNAGAFGYTNSFFASALNVNKGIAIKNGTTVGIGGNTFHLDEFNVIGEVSITNGNGQNAGVGPIPGIFNSIESENANLGGLEIKNGTSVSVGNHLEFSDLTVAGGVSITNGNATTQVVNSLIGNSISLGSLVIKSGNASGINNNIEVSDLIVPGAISLTNGNIVGIIVGGDPGGAPLLNTIDAEFYMSVGSIAIKNGNSNGTTNHIGSEIVEVRGALSVSGGNGLSNTKVEGDTLRLGGAVSIASTSGVANDSITGDDISIGAGLSFTHGAGHDTINVGKGESSAAGRLFINGSVTAKLGEGDTDTKIGGGASIFTVMGSINVSALNGEDTLFVIGDGRVTGGITGAFGLGEQALLSAGGIDGTNTAGLNVGGAVGLTAGANTAVNFALRHGSFGAVTLNGGEGEDVVTIARATIRGAMKVDMKGSGDIVSINDSLFMSSFTALTGAGEDSIDIEDDSTALGVSRFLGAVSVDMGVDNDVLRINTGGPAASAVSFHSSVAFNGGAGTTNELTQVGDVKYYGGAPVITNFGA